MKAIEEKRTLIIGKKMYHWAYGEVEIIDMNDTTITVNVLELEGVSLEYFRKDKGSRRNFALDDYNKWFAQEENFVFYPAYVDKNNAHRMFKSDELDLHERSAAPFVSFVDLKVLFSSGNSNYLREDYRKEAIKNLKANRLSLKELEKAISVANEVINQSVSYELNKREQPLLTKIKKISKELKENNSNLKDKKIETNDKSKIFEKMKESPKEKKEYSDKGFNEAQLKKEISELNSEVDKLITDVKDLKKELEKSNEKLLNLENKVKEELEYNLKLHLDGLIEERDALKSKGKTPIDELIERFSA
jgi:myosin heavy subunit